MNVEEMPLRFIWCPKRVVWTILSRNENPDPDMAEGGDWKIINRCSRSVRMRKVPSWASIHNNIQKVFSKWLLLRIRGHKTVSWWKETYWRDSYRRSIIGQLLLATASNSFVGHSHRKEIWTNLPTACFNPASRCTISLLAPSVGDKMYCVIERQTDRISPCSSLGSCG